MSLTGMALFALLGMLLAIPCWPLLRRALDSRWARRVRRNLPWSRWRPVLLKPYRPQAP